MSARRAHGRRKRPIRPLVLIEIPAPDGRTGLYVCDEIRESDPPAVREGLARRRVLALTGQCPCGAASPFDSRVSPGLVLEAITHAADCPASSRALSAAMRAGGAR